MKGFKDFLTEALINVTEADINFIHKQFSPRIDLLEKLVKKVGKDPKKNEQIRLEVIKAYGLMRIDLSGYSKTYNIITKISSAALTSPQCKKAHAIKPCEIIVVTNCDNAYYNSQGSQIVIGPYSSVLRGLLNLKFYEMANGKEYLLFQLSQLGKLSMKQIIRHELTHWIDDALNNQHIKKKSDRFMAATEYGDEVVIDIMKKKILWSGEKHAYMSSVEINAMVNHIAQLRRNLGAAKYETLTWVQLTSISPGLFHLNKTLGAPWRKLMFKRLDREELIGKNFLKDLG